MKDGKCTKRCPRQLLYNTQTEEDGYQSYKRRRPEDRGVKIKISVKYCNAVKSVKHI